MEPCALTWPPASSAVSPLEIACKARRGLALRRTGHGPQTTHKHIGDDRNPVSPNIYYANTILRIWYIKSCGISVLYTKDPTNPGFWNLPCLGPKDRTRDPCAAVVCRAISVSHTAQLGRPYPTARMWFPFK